MGVIKACALEPWYNDQICMDCREFVDIEVPEYAQQEDEPTEDLEHVRFMARPETYSGHTNTDNEP